MDCREKHDHLGDVAHFLVPGVVVALLSIQVDQEPKQHQHRENLEKYTEVKIDVS